MAYNNTDYGSMGLQVMANQKATQDAWDKQEYLRRLSNEPNLVAALTSLLTSGAQQGAFGNVEGTQAGDISKLMSPTSLKAALAGGMQPKAETAKDIFTGGATAIGQSEAEQEKSRGRLMDILKMRTDVLGKMDIVPSDTQGISATAEELPGVVPEGKALKSRIPIEQLLAHPVMGPYLMKAMGIEQAAKSQGGPWQMINKKTGVPAVANTVEDIAEGYSKGYELELPKKVQ